MATENVTYQLSLRDLMSKGLGDINQKIAKLEGGLDKAEKQGNSLSGMFGKLGSVISAVAIGAFIKDTVLVTAKFQSLGNSIKFASDSAVQGDLSMNWLSSFSKEWGLNLEGAAEGFRTFQGAMMKTKFTSNEVRKMFGQVSMGIVAMGLDAEQAKGVFLALGQMQSKGKISAEELRGQLGERLPGAMAIMARATGNTVAELDDLMRKGLLISEEVLPKFAAEMEKTFGAGAVDNANSLSSNINRLTNSWLELQVAIGESDGGLINNTINGWGIGLNYIADQFRSIDQLAKRNSNQGAIDLLAYMEGDIRKKKEGMTKKGMSKKDIELSLRSEEGIATSSFGSQAKDIQAQMAEIEANQIERNAAARGLSMISGPRKYLDKDALYAGDENYKNLKNSLSKLNQAVPGVIGIVDKEISSLYAQEATPSTDTKAAKAKLSEQVSGVSGGSPKVVNITIEALIKDVKNYFGSAGSAINDSKAFLDQLQSALNTIVLDSGIVAQNGR